MDRCARCSNDAEFKALLESDEDPAKSHTMDLCGNCLHDVRHSVIETWTKVEWLNESEA